MFKRAHQLTLSVKAIVACASLAACGVAQSSGSSGSSEPGPQGDTTFEMLTPGASGYAGSICTLVAGVSTCEEASKSLRIDPPLSGRSRTVFAISFAAPGGYACKFTTYAISKDPTSDNRMAGNLLSKSCSRGGKVVEIEEARAELHPTDQSIAFHVALVDGVFIGSSVLRKP